MKNPNKGLPRPKIGNTEKRRRSCKIQAFSKPWIKTGPSPLKVLGVENRIYPTPSISTCLSAVKLVWFLYFLIGVHRKAEMLFCAVFLCIGGESKSGIVRDSGGRLQSWNVPFGTSGDYIWEQIGTFRLLPVMIQQSEWSCFQRHAAFSDDG